MMILSLNDDERNHDEKNDDDYNGHVYEEDGVTW